MSHFDFYYKDILENTGGARLVNLKTTARLLDTPLHSLYNSISQNKFELSIKKIGRKCFVSAVDLAEFLSGTTCPTYSNNVVSASVEIHEKNSLVEKRKRGRPRKETKGAGAVAGGAL